MQVAIYCRSILPAHLPILQQIVDLLREQGAGLYFYKPFFEQIREHLQVPPSMAAFQSHEEIQGKVDFVFSLGGDGTLLDTLTLVRQQGIPVAGINIGRLGFLANIGTDEIPALIEALAQGTYVLDKRTLLELTSNQPLPDEVNYALNDITFHRKDSSSMIRIHTYLNGEFLNSYFADGLIISTPTGSTGYALSCGGPIVIPSCENILLTPIAPHNLNVRPIVLPDRSVLSFEIEGRSNEFFCTLDSRTLTINNTYQLAIRKSPFFMHLVRLSDHHFLDTLRRKMMWGADIRQ